MPKYRSHKTVWALRIKNISRRDDGGALIVPADEGFSAFDVDADYVQKHNPQVGGFFVRYKDGYESFSPADAFEDGYTRID